MDDYQVVIWQWDGDAKAVSLDEFVREFEARRSRVEGRPLEAQTFVGMGPEFYLQTDDATSVLHQLEEIEHDDDAVGAASPMLLRTLADAVFGYWR